MGRLVGEPTKPPNDPLPVGQHWPGSSTRRRMSPSDRSPVGLYLSNMLVRMRPVDAVLTGPVDAVAMQSVTGRAMLVAFGQLVNLLTGQGLLTASGGLVNQEWMGAARRCSYPASPFVGRVRTAIRAIVDAAALRPPNRSGSIGRLIEELMQLPSCLQMVRVRQNRLHYCVYRKHAGLFGSPP
jgi:hypothetical protein